MKLNLFSLLSFFAIANACVNGEFLRRDNTTVQKPEQNQSSVPTIDLEPFVTLDLEDNEVQLEFFDDGDGIIIIGKSTISEENRETIYRLSTTLSESRPVEIYERLSGEAAPDDLVNAQSRIEKLVRSPSGKNDTTTLDEAHDDYVYDHCQDYKSISGNGYVARDTTQMVGTVEPHRGCVNLKTEKWNGINWHTGKVARDVCVGFVGLSHWWGNYAKYSVDVVKAEGNKYDLRACWN